MGNEKKKNETVAPALSALQFTIGYFTVAVIERKAYPENYSPTSAEYFTEAKWFDEQSTRLGKESKAIIGNARIAAGLWAESLVSDKAAVISGADETGYRVTAPLQAAVKASFEALITAFSKGVTPDKLFTAKNGASSKVVSGASGIWQMEASVKALVLDRDTENETGRLKNAIGCLFSAVDAVISGDVEKLSYVGNGFITLTKCSVDVFGKLVQCGINGFKQQQCRAYSEAAKEDAKEASQVKLAIEANAQREAELEIVKNGQSVNLKPRKKPAKEVNLKLPKPERNTPKPQPVATV